MVFLGSKKVALIIAFRDFRDEEYFVTKEILEIAGIKVKTVSNERGIAIGADGGEVDTDFTIRSV
jgi:putative intracellular protease/amidase